MTRSFAAGAAAALTLGALLPAGCGNPAVRLEPGRVRLVEVARCRWQWTGVAVARDGRVFVNFPRWSDDLPLQAISVL